MLTKISIIVICDIIQNAILGVHNLKVELLKDKFGIRNELTKIYDLYII